MIARSRKYPRMNLVVQGMCWRHDDSHGVAVLFLAVTDDAVNIHINHDGGRGGTPDIRCYVIPPKGEDWEEYDGYPMR